jgi:hypothetical protein
MIDQDDTSVHGAQEPEAAEPTPASVTFQSSADDPSELFNYEDADLAGEAPASEQVHPEGGDYIELPDVSAFAESPAEQPSESSEAGDASDLPNEVPAESPPEPATTQLAFGEDADDAETEGAESSISEGEEVAESAEGAEEEPEIVAASGEAPDVVPAEEMPDDLRAVNELLDRPTAEIMAITEDMSGDAAVAGEGESESQAEDETAVAEGETVAEGEQATAAFDDIEPGTVAGTEADAELGAEGLAEGPITSVSWWPFIGYMVAWLAVAGFAVWQMQQLPAGQAAYESDLYSISILAGLVLLGIGPVLLLIVWLASWIGRSGVRIGSLFISALIKGATATLFGAIVWIGALMLIDYFRLGRPY